MAEEQRMCMTVFNGTVDKLYPVSIIASGAVMNDMRVDIFLTFWGLMAFRKEAIRTNTDVSADYADMAGEMLDVMQKKNVAHWYDTLVQAKEIGDIHIHACAMTADLFELSKEDLDPIVDDIIGVGEFVDMANGATTLYM